jgi:lipopolysaccharide transport system ATP-binding protein
VNEAIVLDGVTLERPAIGAPSGFNPFRRVPQTTVLRGIDLRVAAGAKLGVVGANGAGKSTLLRVIAGILEPTAGHVAVSGSVAPLLELGAGFDPDSSVAENVVLYGVLLGQPLREARAAITEVLRFAELEEYRTAPLRVLSTGMTARLGFATATAALPDVLLLDEVLAVGDRRFRARSRARVEELWAGHRTVVLVSHDLDLVREWCTEAIWIHRGEIRATAVEDRASAVLERLERPIG